MDKDNRIEQWIKDILREDYLSLIYTEHSIHRCTSVDVKRDSLQFINELKALLLTAEVESLTPIDTPDHLVKIRDVIDQSVYTTFQLSVANEIPWLCVDHHMSLLSYKSDNLVANMNAIVTDLLAIPPLKSKRQGISLNLFNDTPVPIMYDDIIELCNSSNNADVELVYRFIKKYGVPSKLFNSNQITLNFLTEVVGRVTTRAYLDGKFLKGSSIQNPAYNGYAMHVFNTCCLAAIKHLESKTAEQRFAVFISNLLNTFGLRGTKYVRLLSNLASLFVTGHFLDINEVNRTIKSLPHKNM